MMRSSVQPSDRIFVKYYGLFSFAKNRVNILEKKLVKTSTYSQKPFDHAKQSATDNLKLPKKK